MVESETIPAPPIGAEVNNLPVQFAFTVPSTRGEDTVSTEHFEKRVDYVKKWMDKRFGGDTTVRAKGGYVEDGDLIEEQVAVVESSMSTETYMDERQALATFIKDRHDNWEQDTVLYRVEDRVFVYPERDYIDDDEQFSPKLISVI